MLAAHPGLCVVPLRGSLESRLDALRCGDVDAVLLAAAGLARLGNDVASGLMARPLEFVEMLPAACQGAVGVTCGIEDDFLSWELGLICHEPTRLEVAAERAVLAALLGDTAGVSAMTGLPLLPGFAIAAHAAFDPHDGTLRLQALVASEDGRTLHRVHRTGGVAGAPAEAEAIGTEVGAELRKFAEAQGWL